MKKILPCSIFLLLLISSFGSWAQDRAVSGKVTSSEDGTPLPGVSVAVKGTAQGTITDSQGAYSLAVSSSATTLTFSYIGFVSQDVAISGKSTIDVNLIADITQLTELIVVGYGEQKKEDLTGSIATVKGAMIENRPFSSVDKALQGQVAGLQSVASSGQPGASQAILIRGASSITASTSPLWVVDGIPINSGDASRLQTTANLLSTLNPNDIESISVLKDAASQSIYGSRAANGVIVVTTKKGKSGKTRFRFDAEAGVSTTAYENDRYKPLNSEQYLAITREGLSNVGKTETQIASTLASRGGTTGVDYNWYDAVTRSGSQQQYNLSMDGGNEKTTYYVSLGKFFQEGTSINSELGRTNASIRLIHSPTEKLTFNVNLNGGFISQRAPLNGGSFGNPILSSYFALPTRSPYNADGSYNFTDLGGLHNPIALSDLDKRYLRQASLRGTMSAEYKILKNLKFKTSYGGDYNALEEDQYNNPFHGDGVTANGRAFAYYTRYYNWVWTNTLEFTHKFLADDLTLNAQAGYESQKSSGYLVSLQNQDFPPTTELTYPAIGARPTTASASISDYSFLSQFALANLNYKSRYVLSGSFRRDGSSRFGQNNKFGNFWSVGASWNLDKEAFIDNIELFDQLKLRASYGVNGNAGIGNYDWFPLYGYGYNYNQQPGSAPSNVGDFNLTWELNKPLDIGLDFGILNNRLFVSVDYYVRKSESLLLNVPLSRTSGFSSATRNVGALENKGIEVTINAVPVDVGEFRWNVDFNFSNNKNVITSLPGGNDITDPSSSLMLLREGESIRSFFLREYAGVNSANGDPLWYKDASHESTTNIYPSAEARAIAGSSLPKYFGSLTNTFLYKGISLSAQLYYNYGNYVYDNWGQYYVGAGFGAAYNKVVRVLDRWQSPGDITDIPQYREGGNQNYQSASTVWLAKGDFIRLRDVQLGYTIPQSITSKARLSSTFVYVRGTNLFTWVKDKNLAFDPEQGTTSTSNLNVFIPKTVTAGISIGF